MARTSGDGDGGGSGSTPVTVAASLATRVGAVYPRLKKIPFNRNNSGQLTCTDNVVNLISISEGRACPVVVNATLNDSGTGIVGYKLEPEFVPQQNYVSQQDDVSLNGYESSDDTIIASLTVTPYTSGYEIVGTPTYEITEIDDSNLTVKITGTWTYNGGTYTGTTTVNLHPDISVNLFTVGSPVYAPLTTIQ